MSLFLWITLAGALLNFVASTTVLSEQDECTIPLRDQLQDLLIRMSKLEKKLSGKSDFGEFIEKEGWVLVFRATSGLGSPVYDTWTRIGYHDDYKYTRATMPCGCTNISGSCDRHYRSRLMDSWPSAALDKVKLALYEEGVEKAFMVFTGLGSDYMNWFSAERLIESSWKDLKVSAHNYFSIYGDENHRVTRRFYVSNRHHNCPGDHGWMSIKDKGNECSWETSNQVPAFIYSRAKTIVNWEKSGSQVGLADVMAVWIKYRSGVDLNQSCLP